MRRIHRQALLGMALVVGLATMAAAQPPAGAPLARRQAMGPRMGQGGGPMATLNLTPDQRQKIRGIVQAQRQANQAAMQQVRDLRKQLREAVYGGAGDEATAVRLAAEIATIQAKSRIHAQLAIAAILTADQLKTVRERGIEFPLAQMRGGPGGVRGGRLPIRK